MVPLATYAQELRQRGIGDVPDFDPLDGGVEAGVLFLFEKPGPKAFASGFISRNNDDGTAENTFKFMQQAEIPREITSIWNVVPGWNGKIEITGDELGRGVACVHELLQLLPKAEVVVLVGKKAQRATQLLGRSNVHVVTSYHPSAKARAIYPEKWRTIPVQWLNARARLRERLELA